MLDVQEVCELNEFKWRGLSIAVLQRLKRLLTGVNDPEAVKRENAAREERKVLAAKHKAEAKHQRKLERQRSVTYLKPHTYQELLNPDRCLLLQHRLSFCISPTASIVCTQTLIEILDYSTRYYPIRYGRN